MCSSNVIKQGFLEEAKYEDLSNLFIYLNRNYTQAILVNSVNFSFYCNLIYIYHSYWYNHDNWKKLYSRTRRQCNRCMKTTIWTKCKDRFENQLFSQGQFLTSNNFMSCKLTLSLRISLHFYYYSSSVCRFSEWIK